MRETKEEETELRQNKTSELGECKRYTFSLSPRSFRQDEDYKERSYRVFKITTASGKRLH